MTVSTTSEPESANDSRTTIAPFSLLNPFSNIPALLVELAADCNVQPCSIEDVYPCTPMQVALFSQTMRRSGDYVMNRVLELGPEVHLDMFCAAWDEIVHQMPILRTRILQHKRLGYLQVVVNETIPWIYEDRDGNGPTEEPIDIGFGRPLSRYAILNRKDTKKRYFRWTIHHALYDGHHLLRVTTMVNEIYHGGYQREHRHYNQFVKYLLQQNKEDAVGYWTSQLEGCESAEFPPSKSKNDSVPRGTIEQIHPIAWTKKWGVTRSILIYSAWALAISHYTGSWDITFGTTLSGRVPHLPGIEAVDGPTIATIPLRITLEDNEPILSYLTRIQTQRTKQSPYIHYGLQNIARLNAGAQQACKFQNLLVVQPRDSYLVSDVRTGTWQDQFSYEFSTYNLQVECILLADGVKLKGNYRVGTIKQWQLDRFLRHFLFLLGRLTEVESYQTIADLKFPRPDDVKQLQQWNGVVPARVERCVHELIAERCRAQPDAPAVCAWDGDLTYGELDQLSSALAAHLAGLGVGPEVFVPLLFEKSRWTPVAMLGVMKAGGAFVLLDPAHPRARLQGICQTVSAGIVVASATQAPTAEQLGERVVIVETDEITWRPTRDTWKSSVSPDNALYAVFTSGSTGAPKGAVISHDAYSTSAIWHSQAYGLSTSSRVLQFSSYAFDASILEHLTTLLVGGCVCTPSNADCQNQIGAAARQLRVTWAELTPSTARLLDPVEVASLATLVLMGEMVTSSDMSRWLGEVRLMSGYGPAECSVASTVHSRIEKLSDKRNIGHGTGCACWVVHSQDHERLLPIGAVGELLIEGPIVGRGYLNDPEKTAAAFIDPPAWLREFRAAHPGNPGGDRLYKTGDLVQYAADGSLRFVGRKDTQVKLRGQRIELGEVEHHTRECFPAARDVVAEVVTPAEEGRAPMLVAFVWMDGKHDEDKVDDILTLPSDSFHAAIPAAEARLHDEVPAYMVPAVFLPLAAVPLTATGKTDRRRLRERAAVLSRAEIKAYMVPAAAKRPPATAAERTLQGLWARVLNLLPDEVGRDDSFFRLGGDSIAAIKLAGALQGDGFNLSVANIFKYPTLSLQAPLLHDASSDSILSETPLPFSLLHMPEPESFLRPIMTHDIANALPTTEFQSDCVNLRQCTYFLLDIPGVVDVHRLLSAFQVVLKRHPILRSAFFPSTHGVIQVVFNTLRSKAARFTCDDQQNILAFSKSICRQDAANPLPFGTAPFQVSLVSRITQPHHVLVLRLSHAQYDGTCLPVLYRDLAAAYENNILPQPSDFSLYMGYRLSRKSAEVYQFWREYLRNASMTRLERASISSNDRVTTNENVIFVTKRIILPSQPAGITTATVVKAAWSIVLARLTSCSDVVFGHVVNARSVPVLGADQILGPCVNIVPVRVLLQSIWTGQELLEHVQSQHMRLLPFETSDLRDIIKNCTPWPSSTRFGSIVQHQNIDLQPQVSLEGIECTSEMVTFPPPTEAFFPATEDIYVDSEPENDGLRVSISALNKMVNSTSAEKILDDICDAILSLCHQPNQRLFPSSTRPITL